ncbi:MAG: RdgB/HAM1 family non-canonical purine NTP pyrophosphatase [Spirochaetia bacterium]|nr:RdgB/HAM1 family non-canonical purine NTP pyrophosphatase [Spirochaetia bacterium]
MLNKVKFVTGNQNKLREAREILGIEIESADAGELDELQNISVEEVIRHKAEEAYKIIQEPLIVEDSGLVFNAWNGLPGALIKWFEKTVGNEGILKMLSSEKNRSAVAQCFIAYHDGKTIQTVRGEISGTISESIRGSSGFGWDQIFIPGGHERTFAEMSSEEKNSMSHRKRAFENLKSSL